MNKLTNEQMNVLLETKEFGQDVIATSPRVAVVLTQDWCPQWTAMKRYLSNLNEEGLSIFYIEYNREARSQEFMHAKETIFGNDLIPYVRYYKEGKCVATSNFVFKDDFLGLFERD